MLRTARYNQFHRITWPAHLITYITDIVQIANILMPLPRILDLKSLLSGYLLK